ncbi:MAG: hypothetical protein Q9P90_01635 [candidate division KSB1 bacterium]|nr:hypothetical protein [candidate division KSB1 bacterium]
MKRKRQKITFANVQFILSKRKAQYNTKCAHNSIKISKKDGDLRNYSMQMDGCHFEWQFDGSGAAASSCLLRFRECAATSERGQTDGPEGQRTEMGDRQSGMR